MQSINQFINQPIEESVTPFTIHSNNQSVTSLGFLKPVWYYQLSSWVSVYDYGFPVLRCWDRLGSLCKAVSWTGELRSWCWLSWRCSNPSAWERPPLQGNCYCCCCLILSCRISAVCHCSNTSPPARRKKAHSLGRYWVSLEWRWGSPLLGSSGWVSVAAISAGAGNAFPVFRSVGLKCD